jgi:hypothetical protein
MKKRELEKRIAKVEEELAEHKQELHLPPPMPIGACGPCCMGNLCGDWCPWYPRQHEILWPWQPSATDGYGTWSSTSSDNAVGGDTA